MARLPAFLAIAALLAVSSAALAQNATTTTGTVDTVKMTGSKGAPKSGAAIESTPNPSTPPQGAHPVLPNLTPPQTGDSKG
jgi:hypothetical protein